MDRRHRGRDGFSPIVQDPGTIRPPGHPNHPTANGQEGFGAPGREALLHSPSGAGGGGTYLSYPACAGPGRGG